MGFTGTPAPLNFTQSFPELWHSECPPKPVASLVMEEIWAQMLKHNSTIKAIEATVWRRGKIPTSSSESSVVVRRPLFHLSSVKQKQSVFILETNSGFPRLRSRQPLKLLSGMGQSERRGWHEFQLQSTLILRLSINFHKRQEQRMEQSGLTGWN
ncbi:hypothetical protein H920_07036 [Fukomys damarensis]|uniref:Uncharacterized protein n=1 Tax=Fukomys damarensis TaxID=885580 RepID=A0A091DK94_FUKDA|nr:hypothetical protein H920_07036 [Fukomys damarensis]